MGRKLGLLLIIILICILYGQGVYAGPDYNNIDIQYVSGKLPRIFAYFSILDGNNIACDNIVISKDDISAKYGGENIEIASLDNVGKKLGTTYYFIVDISKPMSNSFMQIKESIKHWIDRMNDDDNIVLVTFGKEINLVINTCDLKDKCFTAIDSIAVENTGANDLFYDAILYTILNTELSDINNLNRKAFIVISNGPKSENMLKDDVIKQLDTNSILFNSIAVKEMSLNNIYKLGELTKNSKGKIIILREEGVDESFEEMYNYLNISYVLTLLSASNIVEEKEKILEIKVENNSFSDTAKIQTRITNFQQDKNAPTISEISVLSQTEIEVMFSEEVLNANNLDNFTILNSKETKIKIEHCSYSNLKTKILLSKPIYNDSYNLRINNIYDNTMEQNLLDIKKMKFIVDDYPLPVVPTIQSKVNNESKKKTVYIYFIAILIVIITAIFLIIFKVKKLRSTRKESIDEFKNVQLTVVDNNNKETNYYITIKKSIIIGRSSSCEISILDYKISREHCQITYYNGLLYLDDLGSTNMTKLNGKLVKANDLLSIDDVIEVGSHKIVYVE